MADLILGTQEGSIARFLEDRRYVSVVTIESDALKKEGAPFHYDVTSGTGLEHVIERSDGSVAGPDTDYAQVLMDVMAVKTFAGRPDRSPIYRRPERTIAQHVKDVAKTVGKYLMPFG